MIKIALPACWSNEAKLNFHLFEFELQVIYHLWTIVKKICDFEMGDFSSMCGTLSGLGWRDRKWYFLIQLAYVAQGSGRGVEGAEPETDF